MDGETKRKNKNNNKDNNNNNKYNQNQDNTGIVCIKIVLNCKEPFFFSW